MYPHQLFIQCYTHNGRIAVLVEFGLETWMITERPEFIELTRNLAMHIAGMSPDSLDALLHQPYARDPTMMVKTLLAAASTNLGERVTVTRFVRWETDLTPPREPPTPPEDPAVAIRPRRA